MWMVSSGNLQSREIKINASEVFGWSGIRVQALSQTLVQVPFRRALLVLDARARVHKDLETVPNCDSLFMLVGK